MRRAAVSVPSNIAEGQSRYSNKEFVYFLQIAKGSLNEVETQIIIAKNLGFLNNEQNESSVVKSITEISKMLSALIKKFKQ
jgi:four helix bundle protein